MYLLDTNVVSELRRRNPHKGVLNWIADVPADQLFLSAVTVGEIQAGIEIAREQNVGKAAELETWLGRVLASYSVLPMDAPAFRECATSQASTVGNSDRGCHDRGNRHSPQTHGRDPQRT